MSEATENVVETPPATETDPLTESSNSPKRKRAYSPRKKKPAPTIDVPATPAPAPSPATVTLQKQMLDIVEKREAVLEQLALANQRVAQATADASFHRERLASLESEVQYRMGLVAQMEGRPLISVSATPIFIPQMTTTANSAPFAQVGSIAPSPQQVHRPQSSEAFAEQGIRSESAEGVSVY